MISSLLKGYDQNAWCAYHMDSWGHDTNNCWAFKHKLQDLIKNGTIVIAPPSPWSIGSTPLASHTLGPLGSSINMVPIDDLLINPSKLIAPPRNLVLVLVVRNDSSLVALVHLSQQILPFWVAHPQTLAKLTIASDPKQTTKAILIVIRNESQQIS